MESPRVISADEAARLVSNGAVVATTGFTLSGFPEEVVKALERRFVETGQPRDLTWCFSAGQGDWGEMGLNHLGHEGLLKRVIGGHFGGAPKVVRLITAGQVEAYNLPQGQMAHLFRAIGAKQAGVLSSIGLGTFVDPRIEGGKMNHNTTESIVELVKLGDQEWLWYRAFPIHVAIIRGTTADERGNITVEKEGIRLELLAIAAAVRASGGVVIAQVERLTAAGSLDPQRVAVPGVLVDFLVVAQDPLNNHRQTAVEVYNPAYTGEIRAIEGSVPPMPLDQRKVIARRAFFELEPGMVVNIGIGMPEGVGAVAAEEGAEASFTLTVESGTLGGVPATGKSFGPAVNPLAIIPHDDQFVAYNSGGLDIAFMGMAEMDGEGNVNVSRFGNRVPGCGGFIDITQSARRVVFCGTFTTGGLEVAVEGGRLRIVREGTQRKLRKTVEQITFSGRYARRRGQKVLYVTERAVFSLEEEGVVVQEVAPGVDLQRDILDQMEFKPLLKGPPAMMDSVLFREGPMGIRTVIAR